MFPKSFDFYFYPRIPQKCVMHHLEKARKGIQDLFYPLQSGTLLTFLCVKTTFRIIHRVHFFGFQVATGMCVCSQNYSRLRWIKKITQFCPEFIVDSCTPTNKALWYDFPSLFLSDMALACKAKRERRRSKIVNCVKPSTNTSTFGLCFEHATMFWMQYFLSNRSSFAYDRCLTVLCDSFGFSFRRSYCVNFSTVVHRDLLL